MVKLYSQLLCGFLVERQKSPKYRKRGNQCEVSCLRFPTGISMKISQIASASTSSTVAASHWSHNASCDIARPTQHSPEAVTVSHKNRTKENKQIKSREIQKERKKKPEIWIFQETRSSLPCTIPSHPHRPIRRHKGKKTGLGSSFAIASATMSTVATYRRSTSLFRTTSAPR